MASVVDTSVKHAYSSMAGAPVINGTAGSLIAALDAFLVTGWGSKAVDSGVISAGVCRLKFASGKSAAEFSAVILVAGAASAGLNGEQRVTAVSSSWVEFKTSLPDGPVAGSVSFKMASVGWEKVFSKTNVAVYRPTDPSSTRTYYRVDDSNALYARVQMYEAMTDVDSGIGVAPLTVAGGYYWHKRVSGVASTYWGLVGDARGFYALLYPASTSAATNANTAGVSHYAGDLQSYRSGDAWGCVLTGVDTSGSISSVGCVFCASGSVGMTIKRLSHGIGGAVQANRRVFGGSAISGADAYLGAFPSLVDNSLRLVPILMTEGSNLAPRGEMPGAYHCPQTGVLAAMGWDIVITSGEGSFAGKQLLGAHVGSPGSANQGVGFFDIVGPWRV